jgi:hypothetical protein
MSRISRARSRSDGPDTLTRSAATATTLAPPLPRARLLAATMVACLLAALLAAVPARAAVAADGLVVHYPLDQTSGTTATDASGHDRNATVNGDATWLGGEGLSLDGTDDYVRLPDDLMRDLTSITVSVQVRIADDQATPYFIWGLGNSSGSSGNGYLFTTGDTYRTSIATGNWSTERTVSAGRNLARDVWKTLTYTLSGGTAVLYEDGVEVARKTGVTITPAQIGGGTTTANYLGRSLYSGDRYLKGQVRDFRLYDRALTASEVAEIGAVPDTERVARDIAALDLGDTSSVTEDLTLPATGPNGSAITWSSSDESVVSPSGAVTRPAPGSGPATVVLTATVTSGEASAQKEFTVVVPADLTAQEKVAKAADALKVWDADDIRGNITLPTSGLHGTRVSWKSTDKKTVTETGEVHRPAHGEPPASVKLTATVRLGDEQAKRRFHLTVRPLPKKEPLEGYIFSYFAGERYADGEQIYFAASRGNDPLHWDDLNGDKPVLTSSFGEKGIRDPFVVRSPEGDKFYLIATDLKINGGRGWDYEMRHGSKYIEVWESTDLVHWSEQRHVRVSGDTAGMTWAPEATYDEKLGAYVVYWASNLYSADDPGHTGTTYPRMMYATTRDFRTFTEPKVWNDPGAGVIDSTVVRDGDYYYRFTTDDKVVGSCTRDIVLERSRSLTAVDLPDTEPRNWQLVDDCIRTGVGTDWVEGPTAFKSNTDDTWYVFMDETPRRGYVPFTTPSLENPEWSIPAEYELPSRPRHGTVLPVTKAELDRVRAAFTPTS